jgi:indolepyruvate decarboxylase
MSTNNFTVADYLLTRLKEQGLEKIFQVPGDYVQEFMSALDKFDGIDAIGDITELGAGYAAEGYARYKGIGAVSVQYGVGTLSVINAIAGAYVERNPVVVITASPSIDDRKIIADTGALFHHSTGNYKSNQTIFESVTVASEILSDSETAPQIIDAALACAIKEKRPIYLEAWQNVWGAECPTPAYPLVITDTSVDLNMQNALLHAAIHKLETAQQPVIMLGIEIARLGLQDKVEKLLTSLNIAYTTTTLAKSVISERSGVGHDLFVGTYAGEASLPETFDYVSQCDAILALGAIFTDDYLTMLTKQGSDLIRVNMDGALVGNSDHFIHTSLTVFISELTAYFERSTSSLNSVSFKLNTPLNTELADFHSQISYESFFTLYQQELNGSRSLKGYNLILGESSSLYMAARLIGIEKSHFVSDAAWGSLGHETGCSLGVSLANDNRSIVIAGDGGFMMMCQTLSTLSRNHCNTAVFVMSNEVYAIEQSFVDICAFTPEGEFAPFDELPSWNYEALAQAYGVKYLNVNSVADLQNALNILYEDTSTPYLIKVDIARDDLAPAIQTLAESVTGQKRDECICHKDNKGNIR